MKTATLQNLFGLMVVGFVVLHGNPLAADEQDIALEDAMREQILLELAENVERLYLSVQPGKVPGDKHRRTADTGFIVPQLTPTVEHDGTVIDAIN